MSNENGIGVHFEGYGWTTRSLLAAQKCLLEGETRQRSGISYREEQWVRAQGFASFASVRPLYDPLTREWVFLLTDGTTRSYSLFDLLKHAPKLLTLLKDR